jgi:hypothetical protein
MIGNSGAPLEHLVHPAVCNALGFGAKRLRVLEPTFFANGAEVGGAREQALGSPTHPLAHRGAWRRKTGRGSSAPPLLTHGIHFFFGNEVRRGKVLRHRIYFRFCCGFGECERMSMVARRGPGSPQKMCVYSHPAHPAMEMQNTFHCFLRASSSGYTTH